MILLSLSGGMDSAATLIWLLRTGHRVHAHHVSLRCRTSRRWIPERAACDHLVDWCRGQGHDLGYSVAVLDLTQCGQVVTDIAITAAEMARVTHRPHDEPFTAMVRGSAAHDIYSEITPAVMGRRAWAEAIWRHARAYEIPMWYPIERWTRVELWELLPKPVRDHTMSCRAPHTDGGLWVQCGDCDPCRQMIEQGVPLARALVA